MVKIFNRKGVVTLERAKELKILGFDQPCEWYYCTENNNHVPVGLFKNEDEVKLDWNRVDEFVYSAPTKNDIDDWFKEMK